MSKLLSVGGVVVAAIAVANAQNPELQKATGSLVDGLAKVLTATSSSTATEFSLDNGLQPVAVVTHEPPAGLHITLVSS